MIFLPLQMKLNFDNIFVKLFIISIDGYHFPYCITIVHTRMFEIEKYPSVQLLYNFDVRVLAPINKVLYEHIYSHSQSKVLNIVTSVT